MRSEGQCNSVPLNKHGKHTSKKVNNNRNKRTRHLKRVKTFKAWSSIRKASIHHCRRFVLKKNWNGTARERSSCRVNLLSGVVACCVRTQGRNSMNGRGGWVGKAGRKGGREGGEGRKEKASRVARWACVYLSFLRLPAARGVVPITNLTNFPFIRVFRPISNYTRLFEAPLLGDSAEPSSSGYGSLSLLFTEAKRRPRLCSHDSMNLIHAAIGKKRKKNFFCCCWKGTVIAAVTFGSKTGRPCFARKIGSMIV